LWARAAAKKPYRPSQINSMGLKERGTGRGSKSGKGGGVGGETHGRRLRAFGKLGGKGCGSKRLGSTSEAQDRRDAEQRKTLNPRKGIEWAVRAGGTAEKRRH